MAALRPERLRPWADRHGLDSPVLVNMYGITERPCTSPTTG
ncbi:hypothetical protein SALBM217S_07567 [Streptomyces griseoloalbus]